MKLCAISQLGYFFLEVHINITTCKATACVIYCFNRCSSLIRLIRLINCRKVTGKLSTHSYVPCSVSALSSNYKKFNYDAYSTMRSIICFCFVAQRKGMVIMKVVILAGGLGTRISEESVYKPKPMIEIGSMPILWHIMKEYSYYGFHDFVICAGYKQHMIKEWFADYFLHTSDITFDFTHGRNEMIVHNHHAEPWKVTVVDTGLNTMTGGRIKRIQPYIGNEAFMMTYGDGVCDVDISKLVEFHKENGKIATLTAVMQEQQKGVLDIAEDNSVCSFREKKASDGSLINAGYMVLEPQIFDYLDGDTCVFEQMPLQKLAEEGQLMSYTHKGFWQCMDTAREKQLLEKLLATGNAPWKKWED